MTGPGLDPKALAAAWAEAYARADEAGMHPDRVYVTGTGVVLINCHLRTAECIEYGCVLHNPTDPHFQWPTHWRWDRKLMERICPHGVGHPDHNAIAFIRRRKGDTVAQAESIHGCCGCCGTPPHTPTTHSTDA